MALQARHGDVRAGERKRRVVVIEGSGGPGRSVVARGAGSGEARSYVIGVRGPGVVRLVAGVTIRRHSCVVVVGMARRARHSDMGAGKREGASRMVKRGRVPGRGRVANGAVRREAGGDVVGTCGRGEVGLMAGVARGRRRDVVVVGVALRAGDGSVRAGERIICVKRVVKLGIEPVCSGVAGGTVVGETQLHVGRIVAGCKVLGVTGEAICRRSFENVVRMAGRARQRGMRAGERVAGDLEVVELGIKPGIDGVAGLAGRWEPGGHMVNYRSQKVLLMA